MVNIFLVIGIFKICFFLSISIQCIRIKKDKVTDYVLSRKSKGVYNSKLQLFYAAFLHSIKLSESRMEIKDPSTVKQRNQLIKVANVYIAYDLYTWPRNPTNNFKFKIPVWCN